MADGSWSGGRSAWRVIYTSSPQVRDELFHLALLAGYSVRSSIMYEVGANSGTNANDTQIIARNNCYAVNFADTNSCNALYPVINSTEHCSVVSNAAPNTKVYCVSVNSGLIIVRRVLSNNVSKPCIIGNCIKGKSPEQIRSTFNIVNDFTPAEEEQGK